ncbi:barstar family protein [Paenibacillus sp. KACC 21273]|uniref:barstar family protein n=1 Tax=Paenibacillus sp. KACC 21273 TaxID=3025665 RepID=UPI0023670BB6|nr:barstar family protein [Paenibacillus sp. KACC 21273]WDF50964.1 barstar family protein [Paenibacillus sp. KACC 21273]
MISNNIDLTLGQPYFYIKKGDLSEFTNLLWDLKRVNEQWIARLVRGTKCTTTKNLFNEFSAVFQFLWYFGENWNAFDECINDLSWLNAESYVLFISNSEALLELNMESLVTFLNIMKNTIMEWEQGRDFGAMKTSPIPFKIIFHSTEGNAQKVINKFQELGIDLVII